MPKVRTMDVLYIALTIVLTGMTLGLVHLCDRV